MTVTKKYDRNNDKDEGGFVAGLVLGGVFFAILVAFWIGYRMPDLKSSLQSSGLPQPEVNVQTTGLQ